MMNRLAPYSPRFGANQPKDEGTLRRWIYNGTEEIFKAPDRVSTFFNNRLKAVESKQPSNVISKAAKWTYQKALMLGKKVFAGIANQEYSEYPHFDFKSIPGLRWVSKYMAFKRPFILSTPGMGAALILYYIGLIGPRAHRAWERGLRPDGTHDMREMMDVFRRDFWAITVFVYGLSTISKALTNWRQKNAQVMLYNNEGAKSYEEGRIYKYAEHDINAKITNEKVLLAHFNRQENGKYLNREGFLKAANSIYLDNLPKEVQNTSYAQKIQASIEKFRKSLQELIGLESLTKLENTQDSKQILQMQGGPSEVKAAIEAKAKEAFEHLHAMDTQRSEFLSSLKDAKLATKLEKSWPEFKNFFVEYVKNSRGPIDFWAFALLVVFLGYLPVKVNEWWNKRLFEKEEAAKKEAAEAQPLQPQAAASFTPSIRPPAPIQPLPIAPIPAPQASTPWQAVNPALLTQQQPIFPTSYASGSY